MPDGGAGDDLRTVYLQTAAESNGATIVRLSLRAGAGPSPHYHTQMEESFFVIEGDFRFRSGEQVVEGGPGTFIFIPKSTPHSFQNIGQAVGRVLCICTPPGHERYFRELDEARARGVPLSLEELRKLRAKYDTVQL